MESIEVDTDREMYITNARARRGGRECVKEIC